MIENESSMPYLLTGAMTVGLAVLLLGVELGTEMGMHNAALAQPLQAVGGAVIVGGVLLLARYLDDLPDRDGGH
ncbi:MULTISPECIES: hypothetical protein [Halolamina]|uniref:Uncharacterized protein n=1 Tax=Halolamina pelagica TaxID=699431 RepID=A0A1I5P5V7_9EURY|nr:MULTISPECIES: hypothetical protein [Halolamina]NHX36647.1 hypothetical protein [Halolamina sp. R1-12]SFP29425.1 hypothetical protein SAMN05216277_102369 [Halolamina pelagica]